MIQFLSIK